MESGYNPFHNPNDDTTNLVRPGYSTTVIKPTVQTNVIDGFEPFQNEPAVLKTERISTMQPKVNTENLEKLERDLEERSRRLDEREERLREPANQSMNNFPPFPNCCPIKPCFYQAIDVEIPEPYRIIVRLGFGVWLAYSLTLFVNMFGTLAYMIIATVDSNTGPFFGVSILYFLLFVPLSYILWFRTLYKAFRSNSSLNFFVFFFMFVLQIIVLIIQVLGINVLGSCGWIISIGQFTVHRPGLAIFMCIIASAFSVELALCFFIIIRVNSYFRSSGGSMDKAKEEFGRDAASSTAVRRAATGIITGR